MPTIRAFVAIELSEEARAVLAQVGETLARQTPHGAVKWVDPARMHLTLRFLGDTPLDKLDDLTAALDGVALQQSSFGLVLDALGCFPNERKPRVVWVGLEGDLGPLQALRNSLDDVLQPLGWEPEARSFHPHLTLGRVKDRRADIDLPWGQDVAPAEIPVGEMVLFESQLRPQGPRYIVQHTSPFAGNQNGSARH